MWPAKGQGSLRELVVAEFGRGASVCEIQRRTSKVETLWQLGRWFFPDMMALFDKLQGTVNSSDEGAVLNEIYRVMPALNFSSHLLPRIVDRLAVIQLSGVIWSDWGNPERIRLTLDRIAKSPAFPREILAAG